MTGGTSKKQTPPQPDIKLNLRLVLVCLRRAAHISEMCSGPLSIASGHRQYKKAKNRHQNKIWKLPGLYLTNRIKKAVLY